MGVTERRNYRGMSGRMVLRAGVYGVLAGCVLSLTASFVLVWIPGAWWLYCVFRWPTGLLFGLLLSFGAVFLSQSSVEIEGERICVRRAGHKEYFHLTQFAGSSVTRNTHIGSYSKFTTVKCYLDFTTPEGIRRCRLYGFGERDLERVLEAVRGGQAGQLDDREKTENEFLFSSSMLIMRERDCMRKIGLVAFGAAAAVGIIDAYEMIGKHTFRIQLLFLTLLALMLLIFVFATYAGLSKKRKICAERIVIDGDHILVGIDYYSCSVIEKIRLTSPRKKSDSVFPVQRYMYISSEGKTRKYWLGSEVSSRGLYGSFCVSLEQAMVLYPDKLKYI